VTPSHRPSLPFSFPPADNLDNHHFPLSLPPSLILVHQQKPQYIVRKLPIKRRIVTIFLHKPQRLLGVFHGPASIPLKNGPGRMGKGRKSEGRNAAGSREKGRKSTYVSLAVPVFSQFLSLCDESVICEKSSLSLASSLPLSLPRAGQSSFSYSHPLPLAPLSTRTARSRTCR